MMTSTAIMLLLLDEGAVAKAKILAIKPDQPTKVAQCLYRLKRKKLVQVVDGKFSTSSNVNTASYGLTKAGLERVIRREFMLS